jgi:transcription-repair coupling factor (superfamily II helicase)
MQTSLPTKNANGAPAKSAAFKLDDTHPLLNPQGDLARILTRFDAIAASDTIHTTLEKGSSVQCQGLLSSARPLLLLSLLKKFAHSSQGGVLWVCPSNDAAERLQQDCQVLLGLSSEAVLHPFSAKGQTNGPSLMFFPERDGSAGDAIDPERLALISELEKGSTRWVVSTAKAILQSTLSSKQLLEGRVLLKKGEVIDRETLVDLLTLEGYQRVPMVERRGEFSLRGGIMDIFPVSGEPVRLELFGDEIELMRYFDRDTQRSLGEVLEVEIVPAKESSEQITRLTDYLPRGSVIVLEESSQLRLQAMEWSQEGWQGEWGDFLGLMSPFRCLYYNSWGKLNEGASVTDLPSVIYHCEAPPVLTNKVDSLLENIPVWMAANSSLQVISLQAPRLKELLDEKMIKEGPTLSLHSGSYSEGFRLHFENSMADSQASRGGDSPSELPHEFRNIGSRGSAPGGEFLQILTDKEILGAVRRRRSNRKAERGSLIRLEEIEIDQLVVHLQHGIGRYLGVKLISVQGNARDMIQLEYANGDKVYVPVEQMDLIQKYQGMEDRLARLSKMGSQEWTKARAKAKEDADKMAEELLRLYAERKMTTGITYSPDGHWQKEMEDAFPWQETEDQLRVIAEVKADMESPQPMDRLVCGDVGYGKTEVALRAAFKAAIEGRQVAVLVPTTVLAHQHYQSFQERLGAFPVKIELLSRFRSAKEVKAILSKMETGDLDIVIGTHRLLSKDIKFKRLGLLIVDEEHRFGVKQKERVKEMRASVDCLAMTATPIPRTLNMSLMGIRDMSAIETPPEDRVPIKTYLFESHPDLVQGAITRELAREGQVFFIHNRIDGIERIAQDLRRALPQARIAVGHGQMNEEELEKTLLDFQAGEYDVMVCTTIVESGIDIPNVNTILINNAHHFGLAQLYQLRGRVGRSARQAYCYLLVPPQRELNQDAQKRLETIRDFTHLGAGYQIAMKDLEIRGAGDILGSEQSGSIISVGFELYCKMLNDSVKKLRGEKVATATEETPAVVDIPVAACLPDDYIQDSRQKVALYQKIALVRDMAGVAEMRAELRERFGPPPPEANNLLFLMEIRIRARQVMVPSIKVKDGRVTFLTPFFPQLNPKDYKKLQDYTGWRPVKEPNTVTLAGLFGNVGGPLVYPPAEEMLGKILWVLGALDGWMRR